MNDGQETTAPESTTEAVPTTEKHISLAKEIEVFAKECEADVDEAFEAFKAFVLGSHHKNAQAGDVASTPAAPEPETPPPAPTEAEQTPASAPVPEPTPADTAPAADTPTPPAAS